MGTFSFVKKNKRILSSSSLSQHISTLISPLLSSFTFHLFFSAIGASINLSSFSFMLLAPSAFMFALLSLIIHVAILFASSSLAWHLLAIIIKNNKNNNKKNIIIRIGGDTNSK